MGFNFIIKLKCYKNRNNKNKEIAIRCKINVVVINVVKCNEVVFGIETKKM